MKTVKNRITQLIYCTTIIILFSSGVSEEKQNVRDLLINKTWEYISPGERKIKSTTKYSETKQHIQVIFNVDEPIDKISLYYLSETPDSEFDKKKINKNKTGKFIIVNSEGLDNNGHKDETVQVWEILELTDNYLKLIFDKQEFEFEVKE